jgi:hypothetical protein
MVAEAIRTARAAGAAGEILVRGDSAYGSSAVITACRKAKAGFSVVLFKNPAVTAAIAAIPDQAWVPVRYPGAVEDPDTGQWISDAQVAEVAFTAFTRTTTPVTARLVVRRVRDRATTETRGGELFPVWRYHPFFTNSLEPTAAAEITHRRRDISMRATQSRSPARDIRRDTRLPKLCSPTAHCDLLRWLISNTTIVTVADVARKHRGISGLSDRSVRAIRARVSNRQGPSLICLGRSPAPSPPN